MRGLKVFLFVSLLFFLFYGVVGMIVPNLLVQWAMASGDDAYVRVASIGGLGFGLALWFAFRDPVKNTAIIKAAVLWLGLEALVLLITAIAGGMTWGNALPGVILDAIVTGGLVYFYPRGEKAS